MRRNFCQCNLNHVGWYYVDKGNIKFTKEGEEKQYTTEEMDF